MEKNPIRFREEVLKFFFGFVKSGESFYVMGAPSVGKTRLMDFMMGDDPDNLIAEMNPDRDRVKNYYMGDAKTSSKLWLVRVDMNRIHQEQEWAFGFYELLLHTILLTSNRCPETDEILEIKTQLASLDSDVIESKDTLKAHRFFEMAVNQLCQTYGIKLCFLFDEFDEFYQKMPVDTFAQLRAIRDANKYRVIYALFLRNLPERLLDPTLNEGFYELISRNRLGIGPYSAQDTFHVISQLEARRDLILSQEKREWLYIASGGHPGLIHALFAILKDNPLANDQLHNLDWFGNQGLVQEEFRKIFAGLLNEEKSGLIELVRGNPSPMSQATGQMLVTKGILKNVAGNKANYFSPLFHRWLMIKHPV